ncbi:MAG TPA: aldehyde dehydrogenase family protein, partial [Mycobacteriales bacterium]|nr:aldehyde dehydrogenase family protein [Mycobacteriales bacterium]
MATRVRVTYATLSADNEELHQAYEEGLEVARGWLGSTIATRVGDEERTGAEPFTVTSPGDLGLTLCSVHPATAGDVDDAVAAARAAAPGWRSTPWRDRVAVLRRAADLISDRAAELAALMSLEVGKNRLEALGDVEEAAVFFRYYGDRMEEHDGFRAPMERLSEHEETVSVLRPYGVWAVIVPFNFPMALAAGPTAAALVAGNTVLIKPSEQGTFSAAKLHECLREAGVPAGVVQLLPGGDDVGKALVDHPGVDGLTFTGAKFYECLVDAGIPDGVVHLLPGGDEAGKALVAHPGVDGLTFTGS